MNEGKTRSIADPPAHRSHDDAPVTHDVLNSIGECVYEWDIANDHMTWSAGAAGLLSIPDPQSLASCEAFNSLLLPATRKSRNELLRRSKTGDLGQGVPYKLEYALSGKLIGTASDLWLEDTGRWFAGPGGSPIRAHGVVRVIDEHRSLEERLDRMERFDPLTGLFNRSHLNICLEGMFAQLDHSKGTAAFMLIGVDHYQLINSVYGNEAGDAVMTEIARRIRESLRDVDTIGRFSGARIGVILDDCDERNLLIAGHRIINMLRESLVETGKGPISVSAAIGGVVIPEHASNVPRTFHAAYEALTDSHREREASVISYRPDPHREAEQKQSLAIAEKIVSALKEGRIHLAYQPIVNATTHEVEYFEALIRLESKNGDVLDAGDFVGIAEKLGLVRLVDHHALDLALETLRDYPSAKLSLNVSNDTALDPEWISKLAIAAFQQPDIVPRLIIEVTESHVVESLTEAQQFLNSLHDLGFKVALDDFGAGFTSFRNLKALSFDIIKIDGHFATDMENNPENKSFIKALVDLASLFDAKTVVEWVEDGESANNLRDWGVDCLQGYKFGKPLREPQWDRVARQEFAESIAG